MLSLWFCNNRSANALVWVCPLEQLDYDYYLPMFFDGIRCLEDPCMTLARQVLSRIIEGLPCIFWCFPSALFRIGTHRINMRLLLGGNNSRAQRLTVVKHEKREAVEQPHGLGIN